MQKNYRGIDSKDLFEVVKKYLPKAVSVYDITDEFLYEGIYVYDCKISSKNMHVGIVDTKGEMEYVQLEDMILIDDEAALIIGGLTQKIEDEIKLELGVDLVNVDYEPYTFVDYRYDIKFVLLVDFTGEDKKRLRMKRKQIAYIQQSGKSKYLN